MYFVFDSALAAQSASTLIWASMSASTVDENAATGKDMGDITTGWSVPQQRINDGKWFIPVCDSFTNTLGWAVEPWDDSWMPQQSVVH